MTDRPTEPDAERTARWAAVWRERIAESITVREAMLESSWPALHDAAAVCVDALRSDGKLLLFGNGGSAADAMHLAAEFVGRFMVERAPLPAIALSDSQSVVTCVGNDYGFDEVFARPVRAFGRRGDVALGFSTSGQSLNVVRGLEAARAQGMATIAFCADRPSPVAERADVVLAVPASTTAAIQEGHMLLGHVLCELTEAELAERR